MNENKKIAIEKNAKNVRDKCTVVDYGIIDIFETSDRLGYKTIRYPLGEDAFLGFSMIKNSDRIIFSNSSQILAREIFTIAHEIGHQRLHINEQSRTLIKDDNFFDSNDLEVEANYFAACLLMPKEEIKKFIRFELMDKNSETFDGLDIARIQTTFNVSYDMAITRLTALNIIDDDICIKLKKHKIEHTASKLLSVINGNTHLCFSSKIKSVPADFLKWVITNYNEKLIPIKSLNTALSFLDLKPEDVNIQDDDNSNDMLGREN